MQQSSPKRHLIDIDSWERKDNYKFFSTFINSCISITSEVECSGAFVKAKECGRSFFIYYLYAALRAANEIKELRFRIDDEGNIFYFDQVDILTPIRVSDEGKFVTVRIPWIEDFNCFYEEAHNIIKSCRNDSDPYDYAKSTSDDDLYNTILLSATPDLYFTSVTHTQERKTGSKIPLLNAGKAIRRGNKMIMPIAININHSFVDGFHISTFFKKTELFLR